MSQFFDTIAELGSESDDEDYNEDNDNVEDGEGRPKKKHSNGQIDDSSEEEEDDDEEEEQRIREGFIVESDEDEDERRARKAERKKRKREEREADEEGLDEEDLDLIDEANPNFTSKQRSEPKYKRLRAKRDVEAEDRPARGPGDLFDSDEEVDDRFNRPETRLGREDEFADFIEDDEDDDEQRPLDDDVGVRVDVTSGYAALKETAGLSETALEDYRQAFGDGDEYDWALQAQEANENVADDHDGESGDILAKTIELKDVFEPSQLAERMLTDEDNTIRQTDVPERIQVARKPYAHLVLTEEQTRDEAGWISNLLFPRRGLPPYCRDHFLRAIAKTLEFYNVDECEPPYVWNHRKDFIVMPRKQVPDQDEDPDGSSLRLLDQNSLWDVFELDLKFRAFIDKKNTIEKVYNNLKESGNAADETFEELIPHAATVEELQDLQDYLYFQHSARLQDLSFTNGINGVNGDGPATNGTHRRPGTGRTMFEKVRQSSVYGLVRAIGITADDFAKNATGREGRKFYTEDPAESPEQMAASDTILDPPEYSSAQQALRAAKNMFAEEIVTNPKMRSVVRREFYLNGAIDCSRTDKGLKKIDENHPFYAFKYLRNQTMHRVAAEPGLFLQMLEAERQGLITLTIRLRDVAGFRKQLSSHLLSDNFSDAADAWNKLRREALDIALVKLDRIISNGVKESLRAECETQILNTIRNAYLERLDQCPFQPRGFVKGDEPSVLALSNGDGSFGRDPVNWVYMDPDGRVLENGKFTDLMLAMPEKNVPDGADLRTLVDLIKHRTPSVIAMSGSSADSMKLFNHLKKIISEKDLKGPIYEDEDGRDTASTLEAIIVNDEVARLYKSSDRATTEFPGFAPLTKYCVALARYVQNPLKEYAALGRDVISLNFNPNQQYLGEDKVVKALEAAMVTAVNICGVEINDAVSDSYTANLLPYVCGLGPRKAQQLVKVVNLNGGIVQARADLVGDLEERKLPAVGPRVWTNCASFLYITYDPSEPEADYLDNTRVHPEDYDLARKMAADALELDEEDIQAEVQENGNGAVVRKLIADDAQDKVNDLILEEYSEQLEKNFNQRKRATLETIRAELLIPYEELRQDFLEPLPSEQIFTMFTGETSESLAVGMIVPLSIKRVGTSHVEGRLDCGVDATIESHEMSLGLSGSARSMYQPRQTVQTKLIELDRRNLTAQCSLLDDRLRKPYQRHFDYDADEWDSKQENIDRDSLLEKNDVTGRTQRVIKHPFFRPFTYAQAEEYLGSQSRGDVVIRPSSKGLDHLVVTWKVSDNIYQHIDVLELDKENEYALGKTLKIAGKYSYSDLDELIVNYVKAMARKVDEMMAHEKYKEGSKAETERWLTTYTEANPKRSVYAFCINPKFPGYFLLCFKAGQNAPVGNWPVKITPYAYELQKTPYVDMKGLCNGFKLLWQSLQVAKQRR